MNSARLAPVPGQEVVEALCCRATRPDRIIQQCPMQTGYGPVQIEACVGLRRQPGLRADGHGGLRSASDVW